MTARSKLIRFVAPYGKLARVITGPAKGMRFFFQPGMGLTYALGTSAAAPRYFSRWISPGDTIYDVGANQGQMMLLFAALVGNSGKVISFEPSPENFEFLSRNIAANELSNVQAFRVAVSDVSGPMSFDYSHVHPTQGKLSAFEPSYTVDGATRSPVDSITLDSLIGTAPPPTIIKIDVEGAGAAVLRGAKRTIDMFSPSIFIELHGPEEQAGVRDELLARRYVAESPEGKLISDVTSQWQGQLWCTRR